MEWLHAHADSELRHVARCFDGRPTVTAICAVDLGVSLYDRNATNTACFLHANKPRIYLHVLLLGQRLLFCSSLRCMIDYVVTVVM